MMNVVIKTKEVEKILDENESRLFLKRLERLTGVKGVETIAVNHFPEAQPRRNAVNQRLIDVLKIEHVPAHSIAVEHVFQRGDEIYCRRAHGGMKKDEVQALIAAAEDIQKNSAKFRLTALSRLQFIVQLEKPSFTLEIYSDGNGRAIGIYDPADPALLAKLVSYLRWL